MSDNSNLAIGAGIGAVAGAGSGLYIGTKQAAKARSKYVSAAIDKNFSNVLDSFKSSAKRAKVFDKIRDKAVSDFSSNAKNTNIKYKYAAIVAAAGAAIGAGIAAIVNKSKANKAE